MGAPRRHAMIQIYQDPDDPSDSFQQPPQKPRPQLQPSAIPRQPMLSQRSPHNVALNAPSFAHHHALSPQKSHQFQAPMINYDNMGFVELPAPQSAHGFDQSPSKRMGPAMPTHFDQAYADPNVLAFDTHFEPFNQENIHAVAANDNADFPSPSYNRRNHLKRSNSDSAPMNDRGIKRQRVEEETKIQIPEPENMPAVDDDGTKPPYSYAQMIGMAILRAKGRKLTLAQIYDWISRTFAFYREDPKQGWHNSIRHNLSLNKAFGKTERPKGDPGKGCYWVILEGMEGQFLKDKGRKASSNNNNNLSSITVHANVMRPEPMTLSQPTPMLEPLGPSLFIHETFILEPRPQTAPALPDISSDATVPASDPALNEDQEQGVSEVVNSGLPHSSPPDDIKSSPPVTSHVHRRSGSSPNSRRQQAAAPGHKRSATTMNDSGYWSSIESSAMRPRQQQLPLTSDLDIEPASKKRKTGRAEDEIARIQRFRGPSMENSSPTLRTNGAHYILGSAASGASSPPRPIVQVLPATPGVFKKPARPIPESVSPNTQLANHRQQMSSLFESPTPELLPNQAADPLSATTSPLKFSATPGFVSNDSPFQIYDESVLQFTPVMAPNFGHSPFRSAKRPPLARATTGTSNKLHELLQSANVGHARFAKDDNTPSKPGPWIRSHSAYLFSGSPTKAHTVLCQDENEFPGFDDFVEDGFVEDADDDIVVDIASGFPNIGVINPAALSKRRPGLGGRSHSSWM